LVHREHLAEGSDDPRELVAMELLEACEGSSVVWTYSDYERQRIRDLKRAVPELADELADLSSRLVDLQPLIRNHVYHPEFRGSFSLKRVLPALVPALSYDEMDISDGQAASLALEALLLGDGPIDLEERTATRQALLAYCKLDTQAMVALWQTLVKRRRGS
jgi:predicted RecB family nuclease